MEAIERDLRLAKETGCAYVCHISCKESVDLIGKAKEGVDVTMKPLLIILCLHDLQKMEDLSETTSIRSKEDRLELIKDYRMEQEI